MKRKKELKLYHTPKVVRLGRVKSIVQGSGGSHAPDNCTFACEPTHYNSGTGNCPTSCPS